MCGAITAKLLSLKTIRFHTELMLPTAGAVSLPPPSISRFRSQHKRIRVQAGRPVKHDPHFAYLFLSAGLKS